MSKAKKVISAILAIIVLVGVGFGAYILFGGKKDDELTEEKRVIKLVREASDELKTAITTVGSTVAGETNSGNSSQLSASSRLSSPDIDGSLDLTTSSTQQDICVTFLDNVKGTYADLEMVNYVLTLKDSKIQLSKTYVGNEDGDDIYYCISREKNNVILEYDGEKIVVEFNEKDNKPVSISYFDMRRNDDFTFEMSTINFATDKYYYYSGGVRVSSTVTGDDLTNAYNTIEDKIVEGTTLNALKDYVEGLGSDYVIGKFQVLTGNITNDAENVNFKFTEYSGVLEGEEIFNNYASDIKSLEYFRYSKTNINKIDAKNLKTIYNDMQSIRTTAKNQYAYNIFDDKFYFYGVNNLKEFDNIVLTKISNELTALGTDNQEYIDLKPVVDELFKLYSDHKDDENYISVLLCRCDYLQLTSTNGYVENGKFVIEQDDSGKIVVNYILKINITNGNKYDFETQLKEF